LQFRVLRLGLLQDRDVEFAGSKTSLINAEAQLCAPDPQGVGQNVMNRA